MPLGWLQQSDGPAGTCEVPPLAAAAAPPPLGIAPPRKSQTHAGASQARAARCGTPRAAAASLFLISYSNFSAPTPPARHWSASAAGTSNLLASDWPARNTEAAVLIIIFRWLELALGARERGREREGREGGCRNLRPASETGPGAQRQRQLFHSSFDFPSPPSPFSLRGFFLSFWPPPGYSTPPLFIGLRSRPPPSTSSFSLCLCFLSFFGVHFPPSKGRNQTLIFLPSISLPHPLPAHARLKSPSPPPPPRRN